MLDGDDAGRHAASIIAARLQPYAPVSLIRLADSVQPDQLSAAEIREILQTHTENGLAPWPTLLREVSTRSCQPQRR